MKSYLVTTAKQAIARVLGYTLALASVVGVTSDASAQQKKSTSTAVSAPSSTAWMHVPDPKSGDFTGGAVKQSAVAKYVEPSVAITDTNAILRLQYRPIAEYNAAAAKVEKADSAKHTAAAQAVVTLASQNLRLQLQQLEQEHKATKVAYSQAAKSKNKARKDALKAQLKYQQAEIKRVKAELKATEKSGKKATIDHKTSRTTSGGAAKNSSSTAQTPGTSSSGGAADHQTAGTATGGATKQSSTK